MSFKVIGVVAERHPIPGTVKAYVCTSKDDIANLPKYDIQGKSDDPISNAPCGYGSRALVSDGTTSSTYFLNADNNWTKI